MPDRADLEFSAWNPGLEADLPRRYQALETIHDTANVHSRLADIPELKALTGLAEEELVAFRAERLVLHELIVQVTADVVVLEGEEEELLGQHFRGIARTILSDYLAPHLPTLCQEHDRLYDEIHGRVGEILDAAFAPEPEAPPEPNSLLARWLGRRRPPRQRPDDRSLEERHQDVIRGIKETGLAARAERERAIYKSAYRVLNAIASRQGHVGVDRELLTRLIARHACNDFGSRQLGRQIAPHVARAMHVEGYARLPCAREPILISLKGASAAGKSSLRPLLKDTLRDLGIQPDQYGTVSPDIWRRLLLDYEALGDAYKYAGRLAGKEVKLIDAKLDRYIRDKAQRDRSIPNLLIDRFRFDSFSLDQVPRLLDATYARYVDTMYLYFIVTPPEATVERGWERGLTRGRYKAVEDFLGHCVEAYDGMPKLLFKWLDSRHPRLEYFFLDNSVPKHTPPTTIAYGNRDVLHILAPLGLVNIDRYKKINTRATRPAEVYPDDDTLAIRRNCAFLKRCLAKLPEVRFVDAATGQPYLNVSAGRFSVVDPALLQARREDPELAELFATLGVPERQ
ncbi:zeta toxin family protein [Halomonas organivorans]